MSIPEDTSRRDPLLHLAGSWDNPSRYIEEMESAGQRQLVNSDRLPTDGSDDPRFAELGFTFGDPDPKDPMFRPATLPAGWRREGSDHAMWSYILDERGIRRVAIFYKAAFYDRRAKMYLTRPGFEAATHAIYGDGPVTGPWDRLTADERVDAIADAQEYLKNAKEHPGIYGDRVDRAREVLRQVSA